LSRSESLDPLARAIAGTFHRPDPVAEVPDAGVTGFATAYLDMHSVRYGLRCWIEDLAVHPAHRSRGIGKALQSRAYRDPTDPKGNLRPR
jgi:GNAT superfamily N-acetyltransferase